MTSDQIFTAGFWLAFTLMTWGFNLWFLFAWRRRRAYDRRGLRLLAEVLAVGLRREGRVTVPCADIRYSLRPAGGLAPPVFHSTTIEVPTADPAQVGRHIPVLVLPERPDQAQFDGPRDKAQARNLPGLMVLSLCWGLISVGAWYTVIAG